MNTTVRPHHVPSSHDEITTGPVRGIDFHPNQPLFVSGGDDYKIKVPLFFLSVKL